MTVKIYIEGGGDGPLHDTHFRKAWASFFGAASLSGRLPRVIRGKGRQRTYELFVTAVENSAPGELPLLLVDSEDAVQHGVGNWEHLRRRDGWERPPGAGTDHVFLMVQAMESWIVADRRLLRNYFGGDLRKHHLPAWPVIENVSKTEVFNALRKATAACRTGYAKGRVSYDLLEQLDPTVVRGACPRAEELLTFLHSL